VIFDKDIAREYYSLMNDVLGVKIGLAKSVVSLRGLTLEFAKKFYIDGVPANMVPFRDIVVSTLSTLTLSEFMSKHKYDFNAYLAMRDLGFKARAKVNSRF